MTKTFFAALTLLLLTACSHEAVKSSTLAGDFNAYDSEAIRRTIRSHRTEVEICYGATLERDAKIEGKLVLNFKINSEGSAIDLEPVKESSNITDSRFINCIRNAFATWKFPVPPSDMEPEITYPFNFKKHESSDDGE